MKELQPGVEYGFDTSIGKGTIFSAKGTKNVHIHSTLGEGQVLPENVCSKGLIFSLLAYAAMMDVPVNMKNKETITLSVSGKKGGEPTALSCSMMVIDEKAKEEAAAFMLRYVGEVKDTAVDLHDVLLDPKETKFRHLVSYNKDLLRDEIADRFSRHFYGTPTGLLLTPEFIDATFFLDSFMETSKAADYKAGISASIEFQLKRVLKTIVSPHVDKDDRDLIHLKKEFEEAVTKVQQKNWMATSGKAPNGRYWRYPEEIVNLVNKRIDKYANISLLG